MPPPFFLFSNFYLIFVLETHLNNSGDKLLWDNQPENFSETKTNQIRNKTITSNIALAVLIEDTIGKWEGKHNLLLAVVFTRQGINGFG